MTVAELLGRISGEELADWEAYELAHGPLGPVRGDWQAALVGSVIVNANRGKKGKAAKVRDFLLAWRGGSTPEQSAADTEAVGRMLAARGLGTFTEGQSAAGGGDV